MKKSLLGTTAIVGASLLLAAPVVAQEGPELSLDGYLKFEVWFDDQDDVGDTSQDFKFEVDDAEFRFNAKATADNGLTYGLKLEIDVDAGTTTDEARLQFSGVWGTLQLGDDDGAEDVMIYGGESILSGQGGFDGGLSAVFDFLDAPLTSPDVVGNTGDATKVSYFTPRVAGVQIGVSYTPDSGLNIGEGRSKVDDTVDLEGTTHVILSSAGTIITATLSVSSFDPASVDTEDSVEVGVNFVNSFNGVGVALAAVAIWADPDVNDDGDAYESDTHDFRIKDVFSWVVGGTVGYAGFSIGGGYGDSDDSLAMQHSGLTSGVDTDSEFWDVAAAYSAGPFAVSVGYFEADTERWLWSSADGDGDGAAADDVFYSEDTEVEILSVGAEWTLAPGLKLYAEYNRIDVDIRNGRVEDASNVLGTAGVPSNTDNDGNVFMIGSQVSF